MDSTRSESTGRVDGTHRRTIPVNATLVSNFGGAAVGRDHHLGVSVVETGCARHRRAVELLRASADELSGGCDLILVDLENCVYYPVVVSDWPPSMHLYEYYVAASLFAAPEAPPFATILCRD